MERSRSRSKSAAAKKTTPKSPAARSTKGSKSEGNKKARSRSRSRPGKPKVGKVKQPARSRSRSSSKTRASTRSKAAATPRKKEEVKEKELKVKSPAPIRRSISKERKNLNDVVRRSLSKTITVNVDNDKSILRRSGRITVKEETSKKEDPWVTELKDKPPKPLTKVEHGGWFGSLFQILATFILLGSVLLGCTKDQCAFKPFHIPRNWKIYFNGEAAVAVVSFFILQILLSLIPLGRVVRTPGSTATYRANGFLAYIITAAGIAGAWYYGCPVTLAYERWISIAVSSYILAWLLGFIFFVKGGRAKVSSLNAYGNSGNKVYDFFAGREVNPMLFNRINIKVVLLRTCVIGSIALYCLLALKGYEVQKKPSPTLLTAVGLFMVYGLDFLWFEEGLSSTFEAQYEGLGFGFIQGMLTYPFTFGLIPRFILTQRVELSIYTLAAIIFIYILGYFVYRASNLQKATFRKNPLDPTISHLETIPTSRGKKLLVSGWWGIVKHPNYLGDIIMHWAMTAPTGFTNFIPWIIPLLLTLLFIYRAKRDDRRCQERYQGAWLEYSRRVPYHIIPHVY